MERTSLIRGSAPILIVAPHGADDENTAEIAEKTALLLGGYAVINRGWRKSRSFDPLCDMANCNNIKHLHGEVVREEFLLPILRFIKRIKQSNRSRALMVVIHGCGDHVRTKEKPDVDIIVGYGNGNPPSYSCEKRTKNAFITHLENEGFCTYEAALGGLYSGRSKNNLNQFFARWQHDRLVESLQIEIVHELRFDMDAVEMTSEGLMNALDNLIALEEFEVVSESKGRGFV